MIRIRKNSVLLSVFLLAILMVGVVVILCGCNKKSSPPQEEPTEEEPLPDDPISDDPIPQIPVATITRFDNATIEGNEIVVFASADTESIPLYSMVDCEESSTWKLCDDMLGRNEIPSKMTGKLSDGANIYYIVVSSNDGKTVNTYTLTVNKIYKATVRFFRGNSVVYTEKVDTFTEWTVPDVKIEGYVVNGWKDKDGNYITKTTIVGSISLYADATLLQYDLLLDVNGGDALDNNRVSVTYFSYIVLPVATKNGYTFLGWYYEDTYISAGKVSLYWNYELENPVLTAKWEPIEYTINLVYNENYGGVAGETVVQRGQGTNLTAEAYIGCAFNGWYRKEGEENVLLGTDLCLDYTPTQNDEQIVVKFEPIIAMRDYEFVSTATTCTITKYIGECGAAKSIEIPRWVTKIAANAFTGCELRVVSLGYYYTYESETNAHHTPRSDLKEISERAFEGAIIHYYGFVLEQTWALLEYNETYGFWERKETRNTTLNFSLDGTELTEQYVNCKWILID